MGLTTTHLLTRSLLEGNISNFKRLNPAVYSQTDREYVEWISKFVTKYHSVPNLKAFKAEFPNFTPKDYDANLDYIFDQVSLDLIDKHSTRRLADAKGITAALMAEIAEEVKVATGGSILFNEVDPSAYSTDTKILKTTVPFLKDTIGTITATDYLIYVGRMKSQKTHALQLTILDLLCQGYNGVLFTNEITALEFAAKMDALIAGMLLGSGFNTLVYRTQEFTKEIHEDLAKAREFRQKHLGKLQIVSGIRGVDELYSTVNNLEWPADFSSVDGTRYMTGGKTVSDRAQGMASISNGIKMFCVEKGIPMICTGQSNRSAEGKEKVTSDSIAVTDELARDVTAAYHFKNVSEQWEGLNPFETAVTIQPIVSRMGGEDVHGLITDWSRTVCDWAPPKDIGGNSTLDDEEVMEDAKDIAF